MYDRRKSHCPTLLATGQLLAVSALIMYLAVRSATPAHAASAQAIVTLDLSRFTKVAQLDAGPYAGVSPGHIVVHVGQSVVFVNDDTRHHTATSLDNESVFPQNPRWTDRVLHASGTIGAGSWSTGDIAPGARSAPIAATKTGTYLYGCFFDYADGMRGEIEVLP